MFPIPKQIIIGGEVWKVRWVRLIANDRETDGLCDPNTKTIFMRKGLKGFRRIWVWEHELLHAKGFEHKFYSMDHDLLDRIAFARACLAWERR